MFDVFELTLMVNHACNLRCTHCYTGAKLHRPMSTQTACAAIDRAVSSLGIGGELQLSFFGGEPLLEADGILEWIGHAQTATWSNGRSTTWSLTTNGTITTGSAWTVMTRPGTALSISHDGLPEVHDRFRKSAEGRPTSDQVMATIDRLLQADCRVNVSMVVRPETVKSMPDGIRFLHSRGVKHISPTLDLWTDWDHEAGVDLENAIAESADFWMSQVPGLDISWFAEKAAALTGTSSNRVARCGFGVGQVAVSPAGRLYPCERLIEDDSGDSPLRLPGDVFDGLDFCGVHSAPEGRAADACPNCTLQSSCSTLCRCSNYIRTGDVTRPDGLLCLRDRLCFRETLRVLRQQSHSDELQPLRFLSGETGHVTRQP